MGEPNEPKGDATQAGNAAWLKEVDTRIEDCEASIRLTQKRAMIWGGIALVLAAVGSALLVNRLFPDSSGGDNVNRGMSLLLPNTLIWLSLLSAISLLATWFIVRRNERLSTDTRATQWTVIQVVAFLLAAYGGVLRLSGAQGSDPSGAFRLGHGALGAGFLATALGLFIISLYYSRKVRRHEQDLTDLRFEHDLLRHAVKPFQTRAEKLLSVNQIQLRRYYELNLEQARAVFIVGIGCIASGLVVVGATLWFVYWLGDRPNQGNQVFTQTIVGLVGAVGTLLTNFVAYMYFKLHGSISESLMAFHKQLAAIHDLFFANVLAASIESEDKRADAFVRLANAIAQRKFDDTPSPAKVA